MGRFRDTTEQCVVYRYDIATNKKDVTFDEALVREQLGLARHYANLLKEAQLKGLAKFRELRAELYPDYDALEQRATAASQVAADIDAEIRKANAKVQRKRCTPLEGQKLKDARANAKALWLQLKEMRAEVNRDARIAEVSNKIKDDLIGQAERWANEAGLYQATKRVVAQSMLFQAFCDTKSDPVFTKWDGTGRLACQLQAQQEVVPATYENIAAGRRGTLVRVERAGKYHVFSVRVASKDRKPVFARCPVVLHRPFPPDARVKWVEIACRRVGRAFTYSLCFTLARDRWPVELGPNGRVAVNPSWRVVGDQLRVAYWVGDDGREGELTIPLEAADGSHGVDTERQARDLQAVRDRRRDQVLADLATLGAGLPEPPEWLPYVDKIKSPERILQIIDGWPGDLPEALKEYRRKERHLERWQSSLRRKFLAWRRDRYANFWAGLRAHYGHVVVDDTRYAEMRRRKDAADNENDDGLRRHMNVAAPALLVSGRNLRRPADSKVGKMPTTVVDAARLTQTCHACGRLCAFAARAQLAHTCEHCGVIWDQDANHCKNALARAKLAQAEVGEDADAT